MNEMRSGPPSYGEDPGPDRPGPGWKAPGGDAYDRGNDGRTGQRDEPVLAESIRRFSEGDWLSVTEAVAYCASKGLIRNIKTVRRWAHRSFAHPESAEVLVRKQDTETDFRYVIERSSLDVKITQELAFEAQKKPADIAAPEHPGPDKAGEAVTRESGELPEHAEPDMSGQDRSEAERAGDGRAEEKTSRSSSTSRQSNDETSDAFLRQQIEGKDRQIGRLHTQLERRDEQIMSMLERDRETNILIKGLQEALLPASRKDEEEPRSRRLSVRSFDHGDSEDERDHGEGV